MDSVGRSAQMAVAGYATAADLWCEDSMPASKVSWGSCSWTVNVTSPVVTGHVRASASSLRGEGGRWVHDLVVN